MITTHLCDFKIGNCFNVERAFKRVGAKVIVCSSGEKIKGAKVIVVPGVGAFSQCMDNFTNNGFADELLKAVDEGAWVLGICVGMQMLADSSEEFGNHPGLKLISGNVKKIGDKKLVGPKFKLPHVGWSRLQTSNNLNRNLGNQIFKESDTFYFVHSYNFETLDPDNTIATTVYENNTITAAVRQERVFGVQFHPEMSGNSGIRFIRDFLELTKA